MKQEIIEYVKQKNAIKDENYDQLLGSYFDLGELHIQNFIGSKKLTSTLYLVVKEYVLFKFEKDYINFKELKNKNEFFSCCTQIPELEEFFEKYRPLLINYRSLCRAEM